MENAEPGLKPAAIRPQVPCMRTRSVREVRSIDARSCGNVRVVTWKGPWLGMRRVYGSACATTEAPAAAACVKSSDPTAAAAAVAAAVIADVEDEAAVSPPLGPSPPPPPPPFELAPLSLELMPAALIDLLPLEGPAPASWPRLPAPAGAAATAARDEPLPPLLPLLLLLLPLVLAGAPSVSRHSSPMTVTVVLTGRKRSVERTPCFTMLLLRRGGREGGAKVWDVVTTWGTRTGQWDYRDGCRVICPGDEDQRRGSTALMIHARLVWSPAPNLKPLPIVPHPQACFPASVPPRNCHPAAATPRRRHYAAAPPPDSQRLVYDRLQQCALQQVHGSEHLLHFHDARQTRRVLQVVQPDGAAHVLLREKGW